ncbi:tyrosine-type recombinase/integrase [Natrinema ejinorense]|uniref:Tyr recombinase domain-containing protein n=1 Tax=Natrinema ejinorense TaxID=373386 RepID=A0A2A5QSB7_9EURY|nr:tyrosine-type recombinase/integrase [Natrinema ejinorense]PCR89653.1 hypothetical protein CP557_03340 [Natrinema ejinorense]
MSVNDPHNFSERLDRLLLEDIPELEHEMDEILIETYVEKLRDDHAEGTLYGNAMKVKTIMEHIDGPLLDSTTRDIERVIKKLARDRDWSTGTKRNYGKAARAVIGKVPEKDDEYKWDFSANPGYISLASSNSQSKIGEEDVFSREQIRIMVEETARNERDRMLYGLLLDMGLRVGAICTLRVRDYEFDETDKVGKLEINPDAIGTKGAGGNKQVTTWSTPYIQRYLSGDHPRPNNPNAPLLHKHTWDEDDPDDDGSFDPPVVRKRLRRLTADHDEIPDDKMSPHTFRHTAITLWAKRGLSDREIVHRAGWSRESGQLERYEHLTDKDVNDNILRAHGIEPTEEEMPLLADCPTCGMTVEPAMSFCANCGQNLNIIREKPQWFEDIREELGDDDDLVQYFLENQYELKEDPIELPANLYSRLQTRLDRHVQETGDPVIGESFIHSRAPEEAVLEGLEEAIDDFEAEGHDPDLDGKTAEINLDNCTYSVPAEDVWDIRDEIVDFNKVTDTEFVAIGEDGSALRVITILEERPAGAD